MTKTGKHNYQKDIQIFQKGKKSHSCVNVEFYRGILKRILISLTLASCILLAGCGESVTVTEPNDIENINSNMIEVKDLSSFLICEKNTHMLYYYIHIGDVAMMHPYFQNGHLYKYENGKIVEIIEN